MTVGVGPVAFGEGSAGITCFRDFHGSKAGEFSFGPIRAKHVRVVVHGGNQSKPGFDQLEIFGPRSPKRLAPTGKLRSVPAVSFPDGGWGIRGSMRKPVAVNRVVLSESRGGKRPQNRVPISFDSQVSMHGKDWAIVKKVRPTTNPSNARNGRHPHSVSLIRSGSVSSMWASGWLWKNDRWLRSSGALGKRPATGPPHPESLVTTTHRSAAGSRLRGVCLF